MATPKNGFDWGTKKVYYGRTQKVDNISIPCTYVEIF